MIVQENKTQDLQREINKRRILSFKRIAKKSKNQVLKIIKEIKISKQLFFFE